MSEEKVMEKEEILQVMEKYVDYFNVCIMGLNPSP